MRFVEFGEHGWVELIEVLVRNGFSVEETSVNLDSSILVPLASSWMNYASHSELREMVREADPHLGADTARTANLLQDVLVEKGPWGLSSFLKIIDTRLESYNSTLPSHYTVIPAMLKFGVGSPVAAYLSGLGLRDRVAAQQLDTYLVAEGGSPNSTFREVFDWFANLIMEQVDEALDGQTRRVEQTLRVVNRLNSSRRGHSFIQAKETSITSPIMGLSYHGRHLKLLEASVDDTIQMQREVDNPYDHNAIRILNQEGYDLGYVRRETAKIIAPFMDSGIDVAGHIFSLTYPTGLPPWGQATIEITVNRT